MADTYDKYIPLVREPRCNVCNSGFRPLVDKMSVEGYRPTAIARHVQEVDPTLSRKSIERHIKRHLSLEQESLREILETRAEEAKILASEANGKIVTRQAFLDAMIERGWNQISDPNAKVYYKDVVNAIELQARLENEQVQQIADSAMRQLHAIVEAVKELVPEGMWQDIALRARSIYEYPLIELPAGDVHELPESTE